MQVFEQKFGANESTATAASSLIAASAGGSPINVTTFSGGAAALTAAVALLNASGYSNVTAMINNITYVAPGSAGALYNNGHVTLINGGATNGVVGTFTSIPGASEPTVLKDKIDCGHKFGCLTDEFQTELNPLRGRKCTMNQFFTRQANVLRRMYPYSITLWFLEMWVGQQLPPQPTEQ